MARGCKKSWLRTLTTDAKSFNSRTVLRVETPSHNWTCRGNSVEYHQMKVLKNINFMLNFKRLCIWFCFLDCADPFSFSTYGQLKKSHIWRVNGSKRFDTGTFCSDISLLSEIFVDPFHQTDPSHQADCTWHCIFSCVHLTDLGSIFFPQSFCLLLTTPHLPKGVKFYERRFTRETRKNADVSYDCYLLLEVEGRYALQTESRSGRARKPKKLNSR